MIEMLHCHWLNKYKYKLDKLNLTRLWVLVTIYPKNKRKTKHRFTYPKELSSGARLRNEKLLGIYSPLTESGLLDSNDQYTLYAWYEWYVEHMTNTWLTLTQINLSYKCIIFFLKNLDLFL